MQMTFLNTGGQPYINKAVLGLGVGDTEIAEFES